MVDFDLVRKNARDQGIDLAAIAILYSSLTDEEKAAMKREGLITHARPGEAAGTAVAHFRASGEAAFPEKATGVLYLGAE